MPVHGSMPLSVSFDHVGPIGKTVQDIMLVQSILDPGIDGEHVVEDKPLRIGRSIAFYEDAEESIKNVAELCFQQFESLGHEIVDVQVPTPDKYSSAHLKIIAYEAAEYHMRHFPDNLQSYSTGAKNGIEYGSHISKEQYEDARREQERARREIDLAVEGVDCIFLPTMPIDVPLRSAETVKVGSATMGVVGATIRYTALFNVTGHPTVALPVRAFSDANDMELPPSFQVVGKRNADLSILKVAQRIELYVSR